jgi:pSer/pThr/pTyr-binding forkhead associated (FHA) protein
MQEKGTKLAVWLGCVEGQEPIALDQKVYSVGRSEGDTIRVSNQTVSRKHFTLDVREEYIVIQDHNSVLGTTINCQALLPFQKGVAWEGDLIIFGLFVLQIVRVPADTVAQPKPRSYHRNARVRSKPAAQLIQHKAACSANQSKSSMTAWLPMRIQPCEAGMPRSCS